VGEHIQLYGVVVKQPNIAKIFDPARLDAMSEPLFVRVEKLKGNTRTPIPLPAGEDGTQQGTNWSKDDVRGLEQWLVNDWSGGGMYSITVSDSSVPTPQKHDWSIFYNPADYPEKVPPTLSAAAAEPRSIPSPLPQQVRSMGHYPSAFPNGLPGGIPQVAGQPQTVYVPQPTYYQQPYQAPRTELGGNAMAAAAAAADADRRRYEDQLREMQGQMARQREEMLQAQFRQELDRKLAEAKQEQSANNERFSRMEQLIEKMISTTARPAVDPALDQLKEQNRLLLAQAENERREREAERRERDAERRDRETRDLVSKQQEDTRRQMETMTLQLATQNKGPDPMLMFLQENARQQVEAVKEQARSQTAQMQQLQTYMMNPRDILAMAKESSNGLDQATRSITNTYQSILEMQRSAVEQIMQLNSGGGSETIQLIEKGLDRASSFAERFIGGKTREAVTQQQTQAQLAQANAAAMQAQAQAMSAQAAMQAQAARQAAASSGLNGASAPMPVAAVAGPNGETQTSQTSSTKPSKPTDSWTTGPIPPVVPHVPARRMLGHTDEEWFGAILPKVTELRDGVDRFIDSLKQVPPRLNKDSTVDGIEPEQAATVILQAAMIVMEQQIPIQAMIDLLGQGRVADFMDVLLPDAPQPYRDEVAQMVLKELQGGGDDEEEEEEEEADDDDAETPEVAAQPAVKLVKPASRARA
jgi:hypothetical protein